MGIHIFQCPSRQELGIPPASAYKGLGTVAVGWEIPFIIEVVDAWIAGLAGLFQVSNLPIGHSLRVAVFSSNRRHETEFSVFSKSHNEVRKAWVSHLPDLLPLSLVAHEGSNLIEPFVSIVFGELEMNPQYSTLNFLR